MPNHTHSIAASVPLAFWRRKMFDWWRPSLPWRDLPNKPKESEEEKKQWDRLFMMDFFDWSHSRTFGGSHRCLSSCGTHNALRCQYQDQQKMTKRQPSHCLLGKWCHRSIAPACFSWVKMSLRRCFNVTLMVLSWSKSLLNENKKCTFFRWSGKRVSTRDLTFAR